MHAGSHMSAASTKSAIHWSTGSPSSPATSHREMLWKICIDTRDGEFSMEEATKAELRRMLGLA